MSDPEHLDVEDDEGRIWRLQGPFVVLSHTIEYDPSEGIEVTKLDVVSTPPIEVDTIQLSLPKDL